jgi:hypothetical protein
MVCLEPICRSPYRKIDEKAREGRQQKGTPALPHLSAHSHLPYDVTPEQALSHSEVQRRLDISLRSLLTLTEKFFVAISSSVDHIPYVSPPPQGQAGLAGENSTRDILREAGGKGGRQRGLERLQVC